MASPSVAGGWLGTYYYDSRLSLPVQFEATFTRDSGAEGDGERFGGKILDDANGNGEAVIGHGIQQVRFVRFVKTYLQAAPGRYPVSYVGTLSESGLLLNGHWKLSLSATRRARAREVTGTWEARRIWHADESDTAEDEGAGLGMEMGLEIGRELAGAGR